MFDVTVMARCIRWPCRSCATAGRAGPDAAQRQNDIRSTVLTSSTGKELKADFFGLIKLMTYQLPYLLNEREYIFYFLFFYWTFSPYMSYHKYQYHSIRFHFILTVVCGTTNVALIF